MKLFNEWMNEESTEKRIYFAHPQLYYNTKWETKSIQMIMKKWPDYVIINPSGKKWNRRAQKLGFQPFYQAVKLAEFTVALSLEDGRFTGGTHKEMVFADKEGKDVWVVNPWKNTIKKANLNKTVFISKDDPYYDKFSWDD